LLTVARLLLPVLTRLTGVRTRLGLAVLPGLLTVARLLPVLARLTIGAGLLPILPRLATVRIRLALRLAAVRIRLARLLAAVRIGLALRLAVGIRLLPVLARLFSRCLGGVLRPVRVVLVVARRRRSAHRGPF
jgi:hypothetical protein